MTENILKLINKYECENESIGEILGGADLTLEQMNEYDEKIRINNRFIEDLYNLMNGAVLR